MNEDLGSYLKGLRKVKDLTLVELSKTSGVSNPYLSQIENNKFIPSPDILNKLSDSLGVSSLELMYEAGYADEKDWEIFTRNKASRGSLDWGEVGEHDPEGISQTRELINTYLKGSLSWIENPFNFSEKQGAALQVHLSDVLSHYKLLIESLANAERAWESNKDALMEAYGKDRDEREVKEIHLHGKIERELNRLNEIVNTIVVRFLVYGKE